MFKSARVGRVGMRADKMDMEADMRARGVSQEDGDEEMGEEDDDDDDERLRLDELLDELDLLDADDEDNNHGGMLGEDDVSSMRILTVEEANSIAPLHLSTTGFDVADYATDQFKFT